MMGGLSGMRPLVCRLVGGRVSSTRKVGGEPRMIRSVPLTPGRDTDDEDPCPAITAELRRISQEQRARRRQHRGIYSLVYSSDSEDSLPDRGSGIKLGERPTTPGRDLIFGSRGIVNNRPEPIMVRIPLAELAYPTPPFTPNESGRVSGQESGCITPSSPTVGLGSTGRTLTEKGPYTTRLTPLAKELNVRLVRLSLEEGERIGCAPSEVSLGGGGDAKAGPRPRRGLGIIYHHVGAG